MAKRFPIFADFRVPSGPRILNCCWDPTTTFLSVRSFELDNLESAPFRYRLPLRAVTAPAPATGIRISHKVSHNEYAIEIDESLAITLRGDRNVDKQKLVALAAGIADGKLRANELNGKNFRLLRYEMADECGTDQQNQVTVMYQTRHIPAAGDAFPNQGAKEGITERFGMKPDGTMIADYDNTLTRGNRANEKPDFVGAVSVVGAFAAHLQSMCTLDHSANAGIASTAYPDSNLANSMSTPQNIPGVTVTTYPRLPDLPDSTFNGSHSEGIYQTYEIDSEYNRNPQIFQAPLSPSLSESLFPGTSGSGSTNPPAPTTPTPTSGSTSPAAGDTSVFIRGGSDQWQRVVRIKAKRHGKPPRLPDPKSTFRDESGVLNILLKDTVCLMEPQRHVEGALDYTILAEYRYGLSRAPARFKVGIPDYHVPQSLGASLGSEGPFSFTRATIFSSDHAIG